MPGKTLKNRYLIEDLDRDRLGQGAFGQTYLAKDTEYRTEQKVVVKHLQPDFSSCRSEPEKQRLLGIAQDFFLREAKVLEKLGRVSRQIPSLLDNFTELNSLTGENEFYIIQEWIDGEPLGKILFPGNQLTQKDTIQLLIEILEPLDFCHQEGAIHRDLKPDNLMRRHSDGKLVIIDFGAVREMRQLTLIAPGTAQPGSRIGTPGYMPLEQTRGFPVLASDVYAVGAIGIQAMTGTYPHNIDLDADGIPKWRQEPNCYATAEFAAVLNQMLAVLPNARYFDAAAALEALRSLPSGAPTPSLPTAQITNPATSQYAPISQFIHPSVNQTAQPIQNTTTPQAQSANLSRPELQGQLSQEFFSFESAQIVKVTEPQTDPAKKLVWLGRGAGQPNAAWRINKVFSEAERFTEILGNGIQLEMVYVPAGQFSMGSPADEGHDTEKPVHVVNISGFYLGRYLVTQEQYMLMIGRNPAKWSNIKSPVERVSWHEAQMFCEKLSGKTGKKYRLPSEAEWEYACRAHSTTPFYCGATITTDLANFDGNFNYIDGPKGKYREKTLRVDSFPANGFGLCDMHGNLWEWCEDSWNENYLGAPTDGSSWNNGNSARVLRGGAWNNIPKNCRSASRNSLLSSDRLHSVGFRIVCE
jgi:eukaryotic-like serine/threonine-protein kinase